MIEWKRLPCLIFESQQEKLKSIAEHKVGPECAHEHSEE